MSSATFAGFEVAKRGISAARVGLEVTGNNMTNSGTVGYTRQRVDQVSIAPTSLHLRYASGSPAVGEGTEVTSVSQLRDPYLDIRYRAQNEKCGDASVQLATLYNIQNVFNEIQSDGVDTQFSEMIEQLHTLADNPGSSSAEAILKTSASMLTKIFNSYSEQLQTAYDQTADDFTQNAVPTVNDLLKSIAALNKQIRSNQIAGNSSLELQDQRNLLIDSLSEYVNVEVVTASVYIGGGRSVDELSINLKGENGEKFTLVDNDEYNQLGVSGTYGDYAVSLLDSKGNPIASSNDGSLLLSSGDITGQMTGGGIAGYLKMLNGQGEYASSGTEARGIPYYQNLLDTLASNFANTFNAANSTNSTPPYDLPLFESSDGGNITAASIQISEKWQNSTSAYITCTKQSTVDGSVGNENVLYMITLFDTDNQFATGGGTPLFTGTFQEFLTNINTTAGLEYSQINREYNTYTAVLTDIDTQRASVSSVSLDDEGINLISYNHALTAASRLMTTLDEALDTIINGMGIVGR